MQLTDEELHSKLCSYDPRNPIYKDLAPLHDDDDPLPPPARPDCACDNCFYGRHPMADELLRLREARTTAQPAATAPERSATRMPRPCVVIHMSEDLIEDVTVSEPIDVLTINYVDELDNTIPVDQGEGHSEDAIVHLHAIEVDPAYSVGRVTKYVHSNGQEC